MGEKVLVPVLTVTDNPSEVFTTRFSPDGTLLAAGCGDGCVRVYSSKNGALLYELENPDSKYGSLPITAVRFRPTTAMSKTKNVLLVGSADGSVSHWHITSGKCLDRIWSKRLLDNYAYERKYGAEEKQGQQTDGKGYENQIFCVDYRSDGAMFATAGKDKVVRVYDEATKSLIHEMVEGTAKVTPGHSNRVFSLKFNPEDPNCVVSGGWDNTVQIWDIRVNRAVRSIFGPHICGDAVDVRNNVVLTGSWRPDEQLQLWDLGSGKLLKTIPWYQSAVHVKNPAMIYCAAFSKGDGRYIAAGGSGSNEAKLFDREAGNQVIGTITGLSRAVFALDFDPLNHKLAVAGGDTAVRIFELKNKVKISLRRLAKKRKSSSGMIEPLAMRDEQKLKSDDDEGEGRLYNPDTERKEGKQ